MRWQGNQIAYFVVFILSVIFSVHLSVNFFEAELSPPPKYITIFGRSLEPLVHDGASVRLRDRKEDLADIKAGDLVVFFDSRGRKLAKRIVAVEGDRLEQRDDYLLVNGIPAQNSSGQKYVLKFAELRAFVNLVPEVGANQIFVLGENYHGTFDSSIYYLVDRNRLVGKLDLHHNPFDKD